MHKLSEHFRKLLTDTPRLVFLIAVCVAVMTINYSNGFDSEKDTVTIAEILVALKAFEAMFDKFFGS